MMSITKLKAIYAHIFSVFKEIGKFTMQISERDLCQWHLALLHGLGYLKTLQMPFKIEYHAVGDIWWQSLLSYGK